MLLCDQVGSSNVWNVQKLCCGNSMAADLLALDCLGRSKGVLQQKKILSFRGESALAHGL